MSAAGIFFLKGASLELGLQQGLIDTTQQAVGARRAMRRVILRENRRSTLGARDETLLFFPVIKHLRRPCHLVSDSSCKLQALTGKRYAFATIDRHLREMTQYRLAHAIGDTLARCYYHAWYAPAQVVASPEHPCVVTAVPIAVSSRIATCACQAMRKRGIMQHFLVGRKIKGWPCAQSCCETPRDGNAFVHRSPGH